MRDKGIKAGFDRDPPGTVVVVLWTTVTTLIWKQTMEGDYWDWRRRIITGNEVYMYRKKARE